MNTNIQNTSIHKSPFTWQLNTMIVFNKFKKLKSKMCPVKIQDHRTLFFLCIKNKNVYGFVLSLDRFYILMNFILNI